MARDNVDNAAGFWPRARLRIRVGPAPKPRGPEQWPTCSECGHRSHPERTYYGDGVGVPYCLECHELMH